MDDVSTITDLLIRARAGDQSAWDALVERFSPLLWSVCRRHRLSESDAADVGQAVWLRLLEHMDDLRQLEALPGWLATTTARECYRVSRSQQDRLRNEMAAGEEVLVTAALPAPDESVLVAERNDALRAALAKLSHQCRRLLALLVQDPPLSYAEIGQRLGVPVGGLGPTRAKCLQKLRRTDPLASLIKRDDQPSWGRG
jgi:RNA polymerase sigma factor (sigma-70 family)